MNKVCITGRWTKDPVLMENTSNPVVKGTIAVDRRFKKDGEINADYPSVTAFGKTAEHIANYYRKGMKADIVGHLQTGKYEKDGHTVYTTEIIIDEIEFGERKGVSETVQEGHIEDGGFIPDTEGEKIFNF